MNIKNHNRRSQIHSLRLSYNPNLKASENEGVVKSDFFRQDTTGTAYAQKKGEGLHVLGAQVRDLFERADGSDLHGSFDHDPRDHYVRLSGVDLKLDQNGIRYHDKAEKSFGKEKLEVETPVSLNRAVVTGYSTPEGEIFATLGGGDSIHISNENKTITLIENGTPNRTQVLRYDSEDQRTYETTQQFSSREETSSRSETSSAGMKTEKLETKEVSLQRPEIQGFDYPEPELGIIHRYPYAGGITSTTNPGPTFI